MSDLVYGLKQSLKRQTWIDQYAEPLQKAVQRIFKSGGKVGQKIADYLHGTWLGHPLHPVLTDIPVGAWMAAITLDMMEASSGSRGVAKAADTAIVVGVAGAAGAAVTGITDWQHATGETRRTGFLHAVLNTVALGLFIASLGARRKDDRSLGRGLALAGFTIAGASAYLGGDLVFRQKMGVNHAPEDVTTKGFVPVLDANQLQEDRLTIALMNNTPLVLLRRGDKVFALAETCAHLGGPLADGKLLEDSQGRPLVECPWHGSQFEMDSGRLAIGPSVYPQPCFEARIVDGQVEVRRQNKQEA